MVLFKRNDNLIAANYMILVGSFSAPRGVAKPAFTSFFLSIERIKPQTLVG